MSSLSLSTDASGGHTPSASHDAPQSGSGAVLELHLGTLPVPCDPENTLVAGPWCFAGVEDFFPDWEDRFEIGPEPLADRAKQRLAAARSLSMAADMVPRLAEALKADNTLPEVYWETLLAPFCVNVARVVVDLWFRMKALVERCAGRRVHVRLLPASSTFTMGTDQDVVLHGALNPVCVHWICSQFVDALHPEGWELEFLPAVHEEYPAKKPGSFAAELRLALRDLSLRLPCPPLKGMTPSRALRLSLALLHESHGGDRSRPLHSHYASRVTGCTTDLPLDPLPLFLALLPDSLRELEHPEHAPAPMKKPRARVAHILLYEDAAYRQRLALWRARGGRLICVQHGGNYGMMEYISAMELVEYTQHAFVTWGWKSQSSTLEHFCGKVVGTPNFLPLPSPQLCAVRDAWRLKEDVLVLVGTEMPTVGYQMDCHPTPMQNVQYREDKQWFLEALGRDLQQKTLYRPYFQVPGTLDDAPWLLPRFPHVHLCTGPLLPRMLGCRLLVLDHHGTTLLEAMAANVPTICFWDPTAWPVNAAFQRLLLRLGEVGVWHSLAELAAEQVRAVWDHSAEWWNSPAVQRARKAFLDAFAHVPARHADALWLGAFRRL